jgi:hypothetical protein
MGFFRNEEDAPMFRDIFPYIYTYIVMMTYEAELEHNESENVVTHHKRLPTVPTPGGPRVIAWVCVLTINKLSSECYISCWDEINLTTDDKAWPLKVARSLRICDRKGKRGEEYGEKHGKCNAIQTHTTPDTNRFALNGPSTVSIKSRKERLTSDKIPHERSARP